MENFIKNKEKKLIKIKKREKDVEKDVEKDAEKDVEKDEEKDKVKDKVKDKDSLKPNIQLSIKKKHKSNYASEQQKKMRKNCNPNKEKKAGIHGLFGAKGNVNLDNGLEDKYKNTVWYKFLDRMKYFGKNLKKNMVFWISFATAILTISILYGVQSNFLKNSLIGFISVMVAMLVGYVVHLIAHLMEYEEVYDDFVNYNKNFLGKFPESFHKFIKILIRYTLGFHDVIHHNSSINKKWYNIIIEGIQNLFMEGGFLIVLSILTDFGIKLGKEIYKLNHSVILLWALLYTTVHLINYRVVHPNAHINHHMDYYKNLSLTDFFDLFFGTKYNKEDIQDLKHFTFNVIVICILIIFLKSNKINNRILNEIKYFLS
tara:strand:+ start:197 stop:1312 length:1116 start_codon:yes stop_codon:yes gene_type:complete